MGWMEVRMFSVKFKLSDAEQPMSESTHPASFRRAGACMLRGLLDDFLRQSLALQNENACCSALGLNSFGRIIKDFSETRTHHNI